MKSTGRSWSAWFGCAMASLVSGLATSLYLQLRATSAVSLVLLAGAAWVHASAPRAPSRRARITTAVLAAVLALFAVAGKSSERGDWTGYLAHRTAISPALTAVVLAGVFLGLALLFDSALLALGAWLDRVEPRESGGPEQRFGERRIRLLSTTAILACWSPYILCVWPGILTPDSRDQLLQATGRAPVSDHHPVAHTLLVAVFQRAGQALFGSAEAGVATCTLAQAILLAFTFGWIAGRLHRERVHGWIVASTVALAALLPLHAMYSVTLWKNIPFACATVGTTFALWDLARAGNDRSRRRCLGRFAVFSTLLVLLQRNGLVSYVLPAVTVVAVAGAGMRRWALGTAVVPLVAIGLQGLVAARHGVVRGSDLVHRGLSIPVQQVARALVDGAVPSGAQADDLASIGPLEDVVRTYDRHCVDPLKRIVNRRAVDAISADPRRYAKLWWSLGAQRPASYLAAYRDQTCGYWYPDVPYSNIWQNFDAEGLDVSRRPRLGEGPCRLVRAVAAYSENVPLLGAIRSIGLWVWLALVMAAHAFSRRRPAALAAFAPVTGTWVSLLLSTPIFAEVRYLYAIYLLGPFLLMAPLLDEEPRGSLLRGRSSERRVASGTRGGGDT